MHIYIYIYIYVYIYIYISPFVQISLSVFQVDFFSFNSCLILGCCGSVKADINV